VDRLYLNAYVAKLQVAGQVVTFLTEYLGFPISVPALLQKIGNRFRHRVKAYAADRQIPILALKSLTARVGTTATPVVAIAACHCR